MGFTQPSSAQCTGGEMVAMGILGLMYKGGLGVRPDIKEAMKWLVKASESGGANGLYTTLIGSMYWRGDGGHGHPRSNVQRRLRSSPGHQGSDEMACKGQRIGRCKWALHNPHRLN